MTTSQLPKILTEAEVAIYLGVAKPVVARLRRSQKLAFVRVGKSIRIREDQLAAYLMRDALCASTSGTTSPTAPGSITSAGLTSLDARSADQLAQEIARPRRSRARASSSSSTSPATSD